MEQQSNNHNHLQPPPLLSPVYNTQTGENDRTHQQQEPEPQSGMVPYHRANLWLFGAASATTSDDSDTWFCFAVAAPFWLLVSMFVIFGFYGSLEIQLIPNYSLLIQTNTFFVQTIKAEQVYNQNSRFLMLYGFYKPPPLDVEVAWTETHNAVVTFDEHKEWLFYLNKGSKVSISYIVKSPSSAALSLVIAQGKNGLINWVDDPSDPNATLSWNIIYGSGEAQREISESDFYYIAVGNLNSQEVEGTYNDDWYVKISYGPRWIAYFVGSGVMTVLMLLVFRFCKISQTTITDEMRISAADMGSARNPLLLRKDDDYSSDTSLSDSTSPDEEDPEGSSNKGTCVICCDAPRDCFFLPCGHAASCYACATRIKEGDGLCPMCSKVIKKVQRIFTV